MLPAANLTWFSLFSDIKIRNKQKQITVILQAKLTITLKKNKAINEDTSRYE